MKNAILFSLTLFMSIIANAQVPFEYSKNSNGLDCVITSKNFVIENFGESFVVGNLAVWGNCSNNNSVPCISFIFEDISSQNRSENLLKKKETIISIVFEDNTTLTANAPVKEGFVGFTSVCLDTRFSDFTLPGETKQVTFERCKRNISFFTSKNIKRIEFDGGTLIVKSEAVEDPLLKSSSLIKSMLDELRKRYPDNPLLSSIVVPKFGIG